MDYVSGGVVPMLLILIYLALIALGIIALVLFIKVLITFNKALKLYIDRNSKEQ